MNFLVDAFNTIVQNVEIERTPSHAVKCLLQDARTTHLHVSALLSPYTTYHSLTSMPAATSLYEQ